MKITKCLLLSVFLSLAIHGCSFINTNEDIVFQTSTIGALLEGIYDGNTTFKDLRKHGDFGIGTFNALDGEMIGLEGKFYQIKVDGMAYPVPGSMKTPFAVVTFFKPDKIVLLDKSIDCNQLEKYLENVLPTKNIFYAIKIEGDFKYIQTRSVSKQIKPYSRLIDVVNGQQTFEFHNVKGIIAGFWFPSYAERINVPGFHLHFITVDRKGGGHLLDCRLDNGRVEIDYISELFITLPGGDEFYSADLTKKKKEELESIEK
ncbi:MAG TPA: acetolactate decarboxylase [Thermodesulfobacteriota bacterium]|jgi:acetolactate decarboxylase